MSHPSLRQALLETAQAMARDGLVRGTSGNVSVRVSDGYLITPSAVPVEALTADTMIALRLEETPNEQIRPRASSEWRLHRDLYIARPEIAAVVHGHPPFSTAVACARRPLPAFHYMVAIAGGNDIRCADYATFGTQALSDAVSVALVDRQACLMANHGMIAVGRSLPEALALAVEVETLAAQFLRASMLGPLPLLDDAEMDRVLRKFATYRGG